MSMARGEGWPFWRGRGLRWVGATAEKAQGTSPAPSPAPAAGKGPVILFVGSSFFHGKYPVVRQYNAAAIKDENFGLPRTDSRAELVESGPFGGIPGSFEKLTDEAGLAYDVHLEAGASGIPVTKRGGA